MEEYIFGGVGMSLSSKDAPAGAADLATAPLGVPAGLLLLTSLAEGVVVAARVGDEGGFAGEGLSGLGWLPLGGVGGGEEAVTVSREKANGDAVPAAVPPSPLLPPSPPPSPPPARGVSGGGMGRLDGDLWWCDGTGGGGGGLTGGGEEKVGMPLPPFGDREAVEATRLGGVVGGRKTCFRGGRRRRRQGQRQRQSGKSRPIPAHESKKGAASIVG